MADPRGFVWVERNGATWLVADRPDGDETVAGLTFGAGLLHQPPEQLGVLPLLAAWLTAQLRRDHPGAASRHQPAAVTLRLGPTETALVFTGPAERVAEGLRRVDDLLAQAYTARVDDELRDRARTYPNPLRPWAAHLTTRWPGHRPHLAVLGPLALDTLDGAALGGFAERCFGPANRVYWSSDASLAGSVTLHHRPERPPSIAPTGFREAAGTVPQQADEELFSTVVLAKPAALIGLGLLARALHRRLVDFEPLAADVGLELHDVGGDAVLVGGIGTVVPDKEDAARQAVVETIEDLESIAAAEIATVRDARAGAPFAAGTVPDLVRRQLTRRDRPTPATIAREYANATDDDVRRALRDAYNQLLLAVPAEPDPPPTVRGRRYPDRTVPKRYVECDDTGVAVRGRYPVAATTFDAVVLRVDAEDQATTLIDDRFRMVELVWGAYRRADRLRASVDRGTAGVPVIPQRPDPEWPGRLASALRRRRRRRALRLIPLALVGAAIAVIVVLAVVRYEPLPHVHDVPAGTTVVLHDTSTLAVVGRPELIAHYNAYLANLYAVQLRMCGGTDDSYFGVEMFTLLYGEQVLRPDYDPGILERPRIPGTRLPRGECQAGWLVFRLPAPADRPAAVRYTDTRWDIVTWRLPAPPAVSPLTKPCPTHYWEGIEPQWAGCPSR